MEGIEKNRTAKVALALGAGSARGLAHIGVIQVLQEARVPIDMVIGTSMGAVVGAFMAAGLDMRLLGKLMAELDFRTLVDLQVPRLGFIRGKRAYQFFHLLTQGKRFSDLQLPLAVVATDLAAGERVIINQGEVAEALRASISVPGVFCPAEREGRLMVDGAVTERLPVNAARELGADFVIGVDVTYGGREVEITNTLGVFMQAIDLLEKQVQDSYISNADVIIQPKVGHIGSTRFDLADELVDRGRAAAEEVLPQIRKGLADIGFPNFSVP